MKKMPTIVATACAVVLGLAACGGGTEAETGADATQKAQSPSSDYDADQDDLAEEQDTEEPEDHSAEDQLDEEESDKDQSDDDQPDQDEDQDEHEDTPVGETYTWSSGVEMTFGKPKPYEPSEYAMGAEDGQKVLIFDITLHNGGKKSFDPTMVTVTASSGETEAEAVYDEGIKDEPTTKVRPGREVTYQMAFAVEDPDEVFIDAAPDFDHDDHAFIYTK